MSADDDNGWVWADPSGDVDGPRASRRGLLLGIPVACVLAALIVGLVVQTARVSQLNAALAAARSTATAQARAVVAVRVAAAATATAAARAVRAARRPLVSLPLSPTIARPACTAVARAQGVMRIVLHGVKGADTVVNAAARAVQQACAASARGH